jgi:2-amino-4-hydroxy-6-hydroxymethyldihydropteridine diphosphokinase
MGRQAEAGPLRHAGRAGAEVKAKGQRLKAEVGKLAIVALGSNLGESRQVVRQAMDRLQEFSEFPLLRSSFWQTAPVDCPPGSPAFVNAVVGLAPRAGETPESLLAKLQALEKEFGRRPKKVLNEARPLDLDLVAFAGAVRQSEHLVLPHPRAHLRRFVLAPLAEIAPALILPGQRGTAAELLERLPAGERVEKL